ncbi:MAG TPA: GNAT family N-acetyltransferase [Labilithrix sp.]
MSPVREARDEDIDAIARVHVDTWRSQYRGIVPDAHLDGLSYDARAKRWREILPTLAANRRHLLVAEEDGAIVGFASGGPERASGAPFDGEVYAIYVHPDRQRRGIGRALFDASLRRLRDEGHLRIRVWVLSANPARPFYEKLGGRACGTKNDTVGGVTLEETAYAFEP